ncbi:hypothetical protein Mrub_2525 [Meiothermus ruber DSM 1279]|uniref:Uncharacterized protein n=1 Tax=Meiothermus ruber (strain ATCC 35948 / DSM 1279 / VKM B-1258 / 21) TaxID=504728 RepID=A0A806DCF1_MEIRD|nr:hypothetical protein Mrub_2525 [Meiothermus ruber DSM 1279]
MTALGTTLRCLKMGVATPTNTTLENWALIPFLLESFTALCSQR